MKILFLSDSYPPHNVGGAGVVAKRLADKLASLGHEVFVLSTVQEKSLVGKKKDGKVTINFIYAAYNLNRWRAYLSLYNPGALPEVDAYLKELRPDVVHAHNIHAYLSYHSLRLAKKYTKKVFLTAHDVMSFNYRKLTNYEEGHYKINPWQQLLDERFAYFPLRNLIIRYYLASYATKILPVSNALKEALAQNSIKNSEVLYNGIDTSNYRPKKSEVLAFKTKFNLKSSPTIHFGGRLSSGKGVEEILQALVHVVKVFPTVKLIILGQKSGYTDQLQRQIINMHLEHNICFVGWLTESGMAISYQAATLCVTPSICFDSFPTNNLEAMASSLPIVATIYGGSKEQVVDGETGFIVDPKTPEVLAAKIIYLLADPKKATLMGKKGQKRVSEKFSLASQAEKLLKLYNLS